MALPTMPGYWSSRKNIYEHAIVRHRNHEDDTRRQWSQTANYFKTSDVRAAKQQAWSNSQAYQDKCLDTFQNSVDNDVKASNLKRRRTRLANMIDEETRRYTAEMKGLSFPNFERLEEMKARADGLKSAREEKRQKMAEEKLYEHWKQNNPDLRRVESELLQDQVVGGWGDQKIEKEQRLESARLENLEIERQMEQDRQAAIVMERRKEEERLREEKSLRDILKEQMMEFKAREVEAAEWKRQQEELLHQRWELEQIEHQQKEREEERKKKDLGRLLLRQHKAQMMRKSKVIQEELENDRKLLQSLIDKETEDLALKSARKEEARADAQWMKQVLDDQLRVERAREAELDMLYQDEAARMWQKREAEWERERQARQRLMSEVLESRQEQIAGKLSELRLQQEESLQRREELVREMELAQQATQRDLEADRESKMATRAELRDQMLSRQEQERQLRDELNLELQHERQEELDYEDLLRQETQRMKLQGYTARDHNRKQAWM